MKNFKTELLELLKGYTRSRHNQTVMHCSKLINGQDSELPPMDILDFTKWLETTEHYKEIPLPEWHGGEVISTYELSSAAFKTIEDRDREIQMPVEGQLCRVYDKHGNWDNYLYTNSKWVAVSLPLLII